MRSLRPMFHCSACRFPPLLSRQDLRSQFLRLNPSVANSHGHVQTSERPHSTSASLPSPPKSPTPRGFEYRIGASFNAKSRPFNPTRHLFNFNPEVTLFLTGRPLTGQDAFFASRIGNSKNVAFGVADGVGGWASSGIDSAHFSHGLCRYMIVSARNAKAPEDKFTVRKLLQSGYEGVVAEPTIAGGGSTACVAVARNNGNVEVANLGDSGFVQLRLNAIHHYSNPQTHAFNTPYQLSIIPPKILARSQAFGGTPLSDSPRDASVTSHEVLHGDVLIFGTDGVWDNLSAIDVLRAVSRKMVHDKAWVLGEEGIRIGKTLENLTVRPRDIDNRDNRYVNGFSDQSLQTALALIITAEARSASLNTKVDGPYAREVQKYFPQDNFHGGKIDDICVLVAIVVDGSKSEA